MNQRSETSSSLFLDTAHGEPGSPIADARRIHAATAEAQVVTAILAERRRTPIVAEAAHVAHATVVTAATTSSREPIAVIGTTRICCIPSECRG